MPIALNNPSHVLDHGDNGLLARGLVLARERDEPDLLARGLVLAREHGEPDLGVRLPSRSFRRGRELDEECTLREQWRSGDRLSDRPRRCRERDLQGEPFRLCRERELTSIGRGASHNAAGDGFRSTVEAGGEGLTDGAVAFGVATQPVSSGTLPTNWTIACSASAWDCGL